MMTIYQSFTALDKLSTRRLSLGKDFLEVLCDDKL